MSYLLVCALFSRHDALYDGWIDLKELLPDSRTHNFTKYTLFCSTKLFTPHYQIRQTTCAIIAFTYTVIILIILYTVGYTYVKLKKKKIKVKEKKTYHLLVYEIMIYYYLFCCTFVEWIIVSYVSCGARDWTGRVWLILSRFVCCLEL